MLSIRKTTTWRIPFVLFALILLGVFPDRCLCQVQVQVHHLSTSSQSSQSLSTVAVTVNDERSSSIHSDLKGKSYIPFQLTSKSTSMDVDVDETKMYSSLDQSESLAPSQEGGGGDTPSPTISTTTLSSTTTTTPPSSAPSTEQNQDQNHPTGHFVPKDVIQAFLVTVLIVGLIGATFMCIMHRGRVRLFLSRVRFHLNFMSFHVMSFHYRNLSFFCDSVSITLLNFYTPFIM